MDIGGALVRVHGLEIQHVSHDVVLVHDAVSTQDVSGHPCNLQSLGTRVALDDRYHGGIVIVLVLQHANPVTSLVCQT